MDTKRALGALSALASAPRLDVFRLLVGRREGGLLAGEIAERLDVRRNTLSTHLAILERAGLLASRREGRAIRYFADLGGAAELIGFLLEDCCGAEPACCRPALDGVARRG